MIPGGYMEQERREEEQRRNREPFVRQNRYLVELAEAETSRIPLVVYTCTACGLEFDRFQREAFERHVAECETFDPPVCSDCHEFDAVRNGRCNACADLHESERAFREDVL
jgi:hypothetical protein